MALRKRRRLSSRDDDERQLAEMGLKQDLHRGWSAFSNFAISFTIISVLAGCFTTYGQAWNNGGPIAISLGGWILISIPILIIGFCTSEIVAKYPTAGGIYWWAARLGGPVWAWFTGWFNLAGLVGVVASVVYASRHVPERRPGPLRGRHPRSQLRRLRAHPRRDLPAVRDHPRDPRDDQHHAHPPAGDHQQHLGVRPRRRRRDHHRDPGLRPRRRTRASTSSSPSGSTTPASAWTCSGSTSCRSASC